jgi:hypothetical protein
MSRSLLAWEQGYTLIWITVRFLGTRHTPVEADDHPRRERAVHGLQVGDCELLRHRHPAESAGHAMKPGSLSPVQTCRTDGGGARAGRNMSTGCVNVQVTQLFRPCGALQRGTPTGDCQRQTPPTGAPRTVRQTLETAHWSVRMQLLQILLAPCISKPGQGKAVEKERTSVDSCRK